MAVIVSTWDNSADGKETAAIRKRWIQTVTSAPGTVAWRVLLNPEHTTPQVMAFHEFDSIASARQWLASPVRAALLAEARSLGRTSFSAQLWDDAPPQD